MFCLILFASVRDACVSASLGPPRSSDLFQAASRLELWPYARTERGKAVLGILVAFLSVGLRNHHSPRERTILREFRGKCCATQGVSEPRNASFL